MLGLHHRLVREPEACHTDTPSSYVNQGRHKINYFAKYFSLLDKAKAWRYIIVTASQKKGLKYMPHARCDVRYMCIKSCI